MMKFLIIFLALIALVSNVFCSEGSDDVVNRTETGKVWTKEESEKFQAWKLKFNKSYDSESLERDAMDRVLTNLKDIEEHNRLFDLGLASFKRSLGKYSDLTEEEMKKFFSELKLPRERSAIWTDYPDFPVGPDSVDWREFGVVGPIREQGLCGSCWAFTAAQIVEVVMRQKQIFDIYSPQQLVDCNTENNYGCYAGWSYKALNYIKENGIDKESVYPYLGNDTNKCSYNESMAAGHISEVFNIPTQGE